MFRQIKKTFLAGTLWLVGMLLITLPFIWLSLQHPVQLEIASSIIAQNPWVFTSVRLSLILGLFISWPTLIRYCSNKQLWSVEKASFWQQQRLKVTLWLILFEILICENSVLRLIQLWQERL